MSENYNVVNESTVDHELIPCVESLDSIHCDKTDHDYVEGINLDSYINSSIDIGEPIENCEDINCIVLTEKSSIDTINSSLKTIDNNELEIKDIDKQTDDKLMNIDNENTLDQTNLDATGCMDTELSMSLSDDQNKIIDSNIVIDNTNDEGDQVTHEELTDLSTIDVLEDIRNNDSNELKDEEEIDSKETTLSEDKNKYDSSVSEEHLSQNNMLFNSEIYQEQQVLIESSETPLKTNSRPQRQAAKKAENQIREIAKEIIKPLDSLDEKVIDAIEQLSSPLKKVCSQCNRFRLCKFTINGHKAMYLCQEDCIENYRKKNYQCNFEIKCEQCLKRISQNDNKNYYWQTKHFCSVDCLSQYQDTVFDSNCITCQMLINLENDSEKYFRFISGKILQFCGLACSETYVNGLNLCNFCQRELEVENKFEDFCSSFCQTKDYESRKKHVEPDSSVDYGINVITETIDKCNVCFCKLNSSSKNEIQIFSNTNMLFKFCSNECLNKSIVSKKRMVSCHLCKRKKFSFDMISTKNGSSASPTYICSLNCLHLLQQSPQSKPKKVICDKCGLSTYGNFKTIHAGSIYNFCSQNCLNLFQSSKKQKSKSKSKNGKKSSTSRGPTRRYIRKEEKNLSDSDEIHNAQQKTPKIKTTKVSRKISYKVTNELLSKVDKEVQTDQTGSKGLIIPVPVPVYIPMPMHMYVMPYPVPVPFPIPLPIPIFIPTTKNTTQEIMKDIKKIREETPDDPFEADLLLMAGMVADDQKNENGLSSDSENYVSNNEYNDDTKVVSSSARNHNSFGDDVLAMALNMAGADTESLSGVNDISTITSNNEAHQMIDDVEANLVSSTIMPQTPDPIENITQENMISSPQDMLNRPPRKRAPRSQSQRNSNSKRSRKIEYPQSSFIQSPAMIMQQSQQQQVVQNSVYTIPMPPVKPDANMFLKYTLGVNAWRQWANTKSIEFEKTLSSSITSVKKTNIFKLDLLKLTASELNYCLCLFVKEVRKPNGSEYAPDTIYYLCLGIQQYLFENGRIDNIFTDMAFEQFTNTLNEVAKKFTELFNDATKFIVTRVEEEYLWESKQLGAHSPYVLLCTLIFFNTKHFNLTTVDEHMQLSFSHIMKHWKRNPNQPSTSGVKAPGTYRNVLLRFYPPQASIDLPNSRKKKVYEQHENEENPLRCPVKLYEFYLSKCPESVKTRNDLFYLTPERSCVPDSPVWYSTCALKKESLEKMLNRVKMVKEINVALLSL